MDNGASLDLLMAWAILRPLPGKMAFLKAACLDLGWAMWMPTTWAPSEVPGKIGQEVSMFPGYLFVRPPQGQRRAIHQLPFCAGPLEIVIFDAQREQIDREEADRRSQIVYGAKKSRLPKPVEEPVVCKTFMEMGAVLAGKRKVEVIDTEVDIANHIPRRKRDSAFKVASLKAYQSTDDLADAASFSAEAMVRRKMYFQ